MSGEELTFWFAAPVMVLCSLGLVVVRKAVHGALLVAVVMVGLALLYLAQEAPFLGVVQIVVYTGAIMMLFLFVIMLVGVDSNESRIETLRGQRVAALAAGLGFGGLLVAATGRAALDAPVGFTQAAPDGNIPAVADSIFTRYVFAFELTSALLITAAVGAMVLAHQERVTEKVTQRQLSERRFRTGNLADASPLPPPGVYALHNAVDAPALLPDGQTSDRSLSRVLLARESVQDAPGSAAAVTEHEGAGPDTPPEPLAGGAHP